MLVTYKQLKNKDGYKSQITEKFSPMQVNIDGR